MDSRKDKILDAILLACLMAWTFVIMLVALILAIICFLNVLAGNYLVASSTGLTAFILMVAGFAIINYQDR